MIEFCWSRVVRTAAAECSCSGVPIIAWQSRKWETNNWALKRLAELNAAQRRGLGWVGGGELKPWHHPRWERHVSPLAAHWGVLRPKKKKKNYPGVLAAGHHSCPVSSDLSKHSGWCVSFWRIPVRPAALIKNWTNIGLASSDTVQNADGVE